MTYNDIADWAEKAYPIENYDRLEDWLKDVHDDFNNQGHYFPEDVEEILAERWHGKHGDDEIEDSDSEHIPKQDTYPEPAPIQQQEDDFFIRASDLERQEAREVQQYEQSLQYPENQEIDRRRAKREARKAEQENRRTNEISRQPAPKPERLSLLKRAFRRLLRR